MLSPVCDAYCSHCALTLYVMMNVCTDSGITLIASILPKESGVNSVLNPPSRVL